MVLNRHVTHSVEDWAAQVALRRHGGPGSALAAEVITGGGAQMADGLVNKNGDGVKEGAQKLISNMVVRAAYDAVGELVDHAFGGQRGVLPETAGTSFRSTPIDGQLPETPWVWRLEGREQALALSIELLDWYDGLVSGIVRLSAGEGVFLAWLLAWEQHKRIRVYGLLPVAEDDLRSIKTAAGGDMQFATRLRDHCLSTANEGLLIAVEVDSGRIISIRDVPAREIADDMVGGAGESLNNSRAHWLSAANTGSSTG